MPPSSSLDNVLNSSAADVVFFGQSASRYASGSIFFANTDNDRVRQLSLASALSVGVAHFRATVGRVVGVGPEKEVARPHAGWVVAAMEDMFPGGGGAEMEFPGNPVGSTVAPKLPITIFGFRGCPRPTGIGFFDLPPKPLDQGAALARGETPVSASDATAETAPFADVGRVNSERGAAYDTGAVDHGSHYHD
jgi:hypothetical protein